MLMSLSKVIVSQYCICKCVCVCLHLLWHFNFFFTGDFEKITVKQKELLRLFRVSDKTSRAEIDYT